MTGSGQIPDALPTEVGTTCPVLWIGILTASVVHCPAGLVMEIPPPASRSSGCPPHHQRSLGATFRFVQAGYRARQRTPLCR